MTDDKKTEAPTVDTKRPVGRPKTRLPVKLLRGYQPYPETEGGPLPPKLMKGTECELPADEARRLVDLRVAVRNDAF